MISNTSKSWYVLLTMMVIYAVLELSPPISYLVSAQNQQASKGADLRTINRLPSKEKRWALIIGVDNYQRDISPLYGSVNDAKALKDALVRYAGFPEDQIVLMATDATNTDLLPTRGNILDALDKLSRQVPHDGLLLLSFSGHGISIGEDAFLVPSDGRIYESADLMRERSIDVLRVKKAIQASGVRQVLMLIDACRNYPVKDRGDTINPLTESYNAGFSFDTKNQEVDAFATIYATSLGDRAFEFFDERVQQYRGYFSYAIEEALSGKAANANGEVTLSSLISYLENTVKQRVRVEKNQRQIPYPVTEGYRNGELVLALAHTPRPAQPAATAVSPWESFRSTAKRMLKYEYIGEFSEGLARARVNDKWGFVDRNGEVVITAKYDSVCSFSEGLACVTQNDKVGFIDKTGRQVIPFKYDGATRFADGLAGAGVGDKGGYIDRTGRTVIPFKYDGTGAFSEGLASVKLGDKYGFINKSGNLVIPAEYDYAEGFSEGLAKVGKIYADGPEEGDPPAYEFGYIDKAGKLVVEMKYHDAGSFSEGMAVVVREGKQGFINKSGKEVIPLEYDAEDCDCAEFDAGLASVTLGGKYGFVNVRGSEVIPLKYDEVWCNAFRKEGFIGVKLGGKKGFVDIYGKEYFDF
jgi:uncharacterized caspase-like protein